MSKKSIISLVVVALLALSGVGSYNSIITAEENVEKTWANLQSAYQRRLDLIPNAVEMTKEYEAYEGKQIGDMMEMRRQATSINLTVDDLTPENLAKLQKAQSELSSAVGRLIAVSEAYPELKAGEQFSELRAQLEGAENRITVARNEFNAAIQKYNVTVRKFPTVVLARFFGFERRAGFQSAEGADVVPSVNFQ